jgi:pimeloyl-ACP methyl ester carboxylesterase
MYDPNMNRETFKSQNTTFDAILLKAAKPTRNILFATGGGGSPERHLPLLNSLVEHNCTVMAPYFERMASPKPTADELLHRADLLLAALDFIGDTNIPTVGIGHSIGATLLVALAGGQMWLRSGQCLSIAKDERLKKLVLFTPPTGFFQAPKALEAVQTPMQIWSGTLDTFTPPLQMEILKEGVSTGIPIDSRVVEGAGHFSFMNILPPHISDPMKNREEFLMELAAEVCRFVEI